MGQVAWEADKMLDVYIYDYLVKRNLQATAKAFMAEGKVATDPVAIDAPGGFLFEWWSVFWDIFIARTNEKHSDAAAAYFEAQQMKATELSKMQQYHLMQRQAAALQRRGTNGPAHSAGISGVNSDGSLGPPAASVVASHLRNPSSADTEATKPTINHPGQLIQGQQGNMSSAAQQVQGPNQHTNPGPVISRSLPIDQSISGQRLVQGKLGLGVGSGLNQGANGPAALNGWPLPLQGEQWRTSLGAQVHKPFMSNQYQLLSPQQQQVLGPPFVQGNSGDSHGLGDMDVHRFRALQRGGMNADNIQPTGSGSTGQTGSLIQPGSPMLRQDQAEYLMKVAQMQLSSSLKPQEQLPQQYQLQQNNRKRKPTSSGAANSSGTGNTLGPSNSQPSTPSTNTPGDGGAVASNLPHVSSMSKTSLMSSTDGAVMLGSSSNHMDDLDNLGDFGAFEDHMESFLSNDDETREILAPSKNSLAQRNVEALKEIGCDRTSNNKVLCCHFSSDGKLLASAGHEKKVLIWNMENLTTKSTSDEHSLLITDVRFRPDSTQLATSSFDRTVRLWNANEPNFSLYTFAGHGSQVTSLDFHPKKTDILCSCDDSSEIWMWNVNKRSGASYLKGASQQVRFQPKTGQLLAAAAGNAVSIYDFETKRKAHMLQGHNKEVLSICWDSDGEYLASVSHDVVKLWSAASGKCINELRVNGKNFQSCVFSHSKILVVGGYQCLQLWDFVANKAMAIPTAHNGFVAAVASTKETIASASHDTTIKLWKHG